MKTFSKLIAIIFATGLATACSELKNDDHYGSTDVTITNPELKIVKESSEAYISGRSDMSSMSALFASEGIFDELNQKGQLSTILVVTNDHFTQPEEKVNFVTRSHVSDMSVSPANLHNGDRLMMWHGKYVNVSMDEEGQEGIIIDHLMFNNAHVKEVIKTGNGYVYVIDEMINTPTSLRDYIDNLGDDYSIFKEMVNASGGKEFDRANSKAIGINAEGNTVYDSVFIYTNTFFENQGFDMNSESLTATMLLFSNDVINNALYDAHDRLQKWGLERKDSLMKDWILKVAFFKKQYTAEELTDSEEPLSSIFNKDWDTKKQNIDLANPENLSNGIVYKVNKLILPQNVLIYRLKDCFYHYEVCTAEQKEEFFKMTNMKFDKCNTEVAAWTPWEGVWPLHENRVMQVSKTEDVTPEDGFILDFTLIKQNDDGTISPFLIPPGNYRLAMGSKQNMNIDVIVTVFAEGQEIAKSELVNWGGNTAFHYDRGNTLPYCYPEGYNASYVSANSSSPNKNKAGNYDTDGGLILQELAIPDIKGDGSPVKVVLRIQCEKWYVDPSKGTASSVIFNHWCLRPIPFNK